MTVPIGNINFTRVSTLSLYTCNDTREETHTMTVPIQLIQLKQEFKVEIYACRIEIQRNVYHCSYGDYLAAVPGGVGSYMYSVGRDICRQAHKTGVLVFTLPNGKHFSQSNHQASKMVTTPVVLAGTADNDGDCTRGTYNDPFGSWEDVVALGTVTVLLRRFKASVTPDTNKIYPRSGLACDYQAGKCEDTLDGELFWSPIDEDSCRVLRRRVIYDGLGKLTFANSTVTTPPDNWDGAIISVTGRKVIHILQNTQN